MEKRINYNKEEEEKEEYYFDDNIIDTMRTDKLKRKKKNIKINKIKIPRVDNIKTKA